MSKEYGLHGEPAEPVEPTEPAEPAEHAEGLDPPPPAAGGADGPGLDLESMDEDALRRLLRDSVRDVEPSADALEHLRHAVPARRARRRQVAVGAVAAVLVCGAAVPAMLHADFGPGGDKPMHTAGHSQNHVESEKEAAGGDDGDRPPIENPRAGGQSGEADRGVKSGAPTTGSSSGPYPSSTLGPISPTCTRDQLGKAGGAHGEADARGHVYGTFRVVNTSEASCTVEGDGIVLATAQGSAKSDMIQVVDHTTGDEATGLPDPVNAADEVVLEPGGAYVVEFAWIPRDGGGATGCSTTSPSPGGEDGEDSQTSGGGQEPMGSSGSVADDSDGGSTGGSTGGEGGEGTPDTGSGTEGTASGGTGSTGGTDGGTGSTGGGGGGGEDPAPEASVLLSHTPDVGQPEAADVVLPGACAGTLYRTGVLPAA